MRYLEGFDVIYLDIREPHPVPLTAEGSDSETVYIHIYGARATIVSIASRRGITPPSPPRWLGMADRIARSRRIIPLHGPLRLLRHCQATHLAQNPEKVGHLAADLCLVLRLLSRLIDVLLDEDLLAEIERREDVSGLLTVRGEVGSIAELPGDVDNQIIQIASYPQVVHNFHSGVVIRMFELLLSLCFLLICLLWGNVVYRGV